MEERWLSTNKEVSGYSSAQVRVDGKNRYHVPATNRHAVVPKVVEKNVDSSSKSIPCVVVKKITTRLCEGVGVVEKNKKVDELSTKMCVIYLQE